MGEEPELIAELGDFCPGSATLILSDCLAMVNLALAKKAGTDKILDKLGAPEETINRLPSLLIQQ